MKMTLISDKNDWDLYKKTLDVKLHKNCHHSDDPKDFPVLVDTRIDDYNVCWHMYEYTRSHVCCGCGRHDIITPVGIEAIPFN